MDDAATISEVFDERPELEASMGAVLAVDDKHDEWTFDDVPIGSGEFGELVSRGLVEPTADGDGYQVANPATVRVVLDDNAGETADETESVDLSAMCHKTISDRLESVDTVQIGALVGALLIVVLARAYVYPSVFRDGAIVLSGNDPYYYRYWVEQALAASGGVYDFSSLATMSEAVQTGEPLLVATLWTLASLVGGDMTAAGWVLAWYPVFAALITGYLVYHLTMVVTDDRRVAIAALAMLAITPAHAFRTSLGYADHHAFDYVWLMITAYALVQLAERANAVWNENNQWVWAGALGLGVGGQILAWEGGPLLIVPFTGFITVRVFQDIRSERAPLVANLPVLGGLVFGTLFVYAGHALADWHSDTVAFSPVLLTLGVLGVLSIGEIVHRYELSVNVFASITTVASATGLLALRTLRPDYWAELMVGISRITASRNIVETQSLLSGDTLGWLLLFGFVLVLAVPFLALQSVAAYRGERAWLVPVVYGWYFLLLGMYQVRFAGQLAMFASMFAGLGFVYLAAVVDLTEEPVSFGGEMERVSSVSLPSQRAVAQLAVLFLLVSGLSVVQVPIKTSQVVTDGEKYRAAVWMNEYATEQGWEYPQNYVFSQWGENRMYNYFVNGQSRSYGFAGDYFADFSTTTENVRWYRFLRDRAGFVVLGPDQYEAGTLHAQLHDIVANRSTPTDIGHYRAVYIANDGAPVVFTLVQGAIITGTLPANGTIPISTDVEVNGSTFTYERRPEGRAGVYMITVPYPGTYDIGPNRTTVTERAVRRGQRYELFYGPGSAYWSFEETSGLRAHDRWGGNHLLVNGSAWTQDGLVISNGYVARGSENGEFMSLSANESLRLEFTIRGNLSESPRTLPGVISARGDGRIRVWARTDKNTFGIGIDDDEGDSARLFDIQSTAFDSPTQVTVVLDRSSDELRLYRNDSLVGTRDASEIDAVTVDRPITVGGFPGAATSPVILSDLRVYNGSIDSIGAEPS